MLLQTCHYRIKDSSGVAWLEAAARSVNYVWNYCNSTAFHALKRDGRGLTGFDLNNLTSGTSKELGLAATTIQAIGQKYASSRSQFRKAKLRYRGKKSTGGVPFKGAAIKILSNDTIKYNGKTIMYWNSKDLPGKVHCGAFGRDTRGRWYKAVKAIHAKIANSRKYTCHKISTEITKTYKDIFVGDMSCEKLIKTNMAKSVNDAGWAMLRTFLKYKAVRRSGTYIEVNEYLTSQTCSYCLTVGGPKGFEGLGIREWVCGNCTRLHDRDVNAAINILRLGHQTWVLK
jgi:IS605 OrfB family transposase